MYFACFLSRLLVLFAMLGDGYVFLPLHARREYAKDDLSLSSLVPSYSLQQRFEELRWRDVQSISFLEKQLQSRDNTEKDRLRARKKLQKKGAEGHFDACWVLFDHAQKCNKIGDAVHHLRSLHAINPLECARRIIEAPAEKPNQRKHILTQLMQQHNGNHTTYPFDPQICFTMNLLLAIESVKKDRVSDGDRDAATAYIQQAFSFPVSEAFLETMQPVFDAMVASGLLEDGEMTAARNLMRECRERWLTGLLAEFHVPLERTYSTARALFDAARDASRSGKSASARELIAKADEICSLMQPLDPLHAALQTELHYERALLLAPTNILEIEPLPFDCEMIACCARYLRQLIQHCNARFDMRDQVIYAGNLLHNLYARKGLHACEWEQVLYALLSCKLVKNTQLESLVKIFEKLPQCERACERCSERDFTARMLMLPQLEAEREFMTLAENLLAVSGQQNRLWEEQPALRDSFIIKCADTFAESFDNIERAAEIIPLLREVLARVKAPELAGKIYYYLGLFSYRHDAQGAKKYFSEAVKHGCLTANIALAACTEPRDFLVAIEYLMAATAGRSVDQMSTMVPMFHYFCKRLNLGTPVACLERFAEWLLHGAAIIATENNAFEVASSSIAVVYMGTSKIFIPADPLRAWRLIESLAQHQNAWARGMVNELGTILAKRMYYEQQHSNERDAARLAYDAVCAINSLPDTADKQKYSAQIREFFVKKREEQATLSDKAQAQFQKKIRADQKTIKKQEKKALKKKNKPASTVVVSAAPLSDEAGFWQKEIERCEHAIQILNQVLTRIDSIDSVQCAPREPASPQQTELAALKAALAARNLSHIQPGSHLAIQRIFLHRLMHLHEMEHEYPQACKYAGTLLRVLDGETMCACQWVACFDALRAASCVHGREYSDGTDVLIRLTDDTTAARCARAECGFDMRALYKALIVRGCEAINAQRYTAASDDLIRALTLADKNAWPDDEYITAACQLGRACEHLGGDQFDRAVVSKILDQAYARAAKIKDQRTVLELPWYTGLCTPDRTKARNTFILCMQLGKPEAGIAAAILTSNQQEAYVLLSEASKLYTPTVLVKKYCHFSRQRGIKITANSAIFQYIGWIISQDFVAGWEMLEELARCDVAAAKNLQQNFGTYIANSWLRVAEKGTALHGTKSIAPADIIKLSLQHIQKISEVASITREQKKEFFGQILACLEPYSTREKCASQPSLASSMPTIYALIQNKLACLDTSHNTMR